MAAIGKIRNQGWLLMTIMVISLIAFLLMEVGGDGGGRVRPSDELAIVDGEVISNQVFNDNLSANIANYRNQSKQQTLSDATLTGIKNSTYTQMITDKLLEKVYKNVGIKVSTAEFLDMIGGENIHQGIKNSFKNEAGEFDRDQFTNYINSLDLENSPTDEPGTKRKAWSKFEQAIVKERLSTKYNNLISKSMTVPTFMAKDDFMSSNGQATINFVKVPFSSISDSSITLSDADLASYVKRNANDFQQEETVNLKFVSFPIVASENDKIAASKWIDKKVGEWATAKSDSLFVGLYSDEAFDGAYFKKDELNSAYKDSMFVVKPGTIFGADKVGNAFVATKLLDRKLIPDSLKARHLLISFDNVTSQEEAAAKYQLFDSLFTLVDSLDYDLETLTAQFSDDKSNANNGGDLNWVKPNQMVKPFNDLIFFGMKAGDVKKVSTKFGLHIVEVYKSKATTPAVKIATLKKEILASSKTQEKIYADASRFSGNNNTVEKFKAAEETTNVRNAYEVAKDASIIQGIQGNARQLVKWAFENEQGTVSSPFSIGETYYVAIIQDKNEKGLTKINDYNRLRINLAAVKEKKAEKLVEKMQGSDLNTIASANNVTVANASSISFKNVTVAGSQEPKVVGAALGMAVNTVSKPIIGNDGVYVISVTANTPATENAAAIESSKRTLGSAMNSAITSGLNEALKKAAEVKDNRFDFF